MTAGEHRSGLQAGFAFVVLAVAIAIAMRLELHAPQYGDLAWQIPEGLQILGGHLPSAVPYAIEAGPWLDHEWLFEAVAAWSYAHGAYAAFAIACLLAFGFFPVLVYALLRTKHGDLAASIVALLALAGIFFTSPYRPQTFAYYFFALVAYQLRAERPNALRIFAYVVLWANLHASVVLAPVVAVLALLGAWKERVPQPQLRALAIAGGATLAGTLITPFGPRLWLYAAQLSDAPFGQYIREWRPLDFSQPEAQFVFLPALALLAASGLRATRENSGALFVAVPFFILAAEHVRHVAFLVPAVAPILATQLEAWPPFVWLAARFARYERSASYVFVATLPLGALFVFSSAPDATFDPRAQGFAADVVALAREQRIAGNAYIARPFAAYLPFAGVDGVKLLIDSHADPYPLDVWDDAHELETLGPKFRDVLARRKLDAIITDRGSALALGMELLPGWRATTRGDAEAFVQTR